MLDWLFYNISISAIIETIIGGCVLTLIIFLIKEILCPLPYLYGHWIFEITYKKTKYNPYKGMKLKYKILINQKNKELLGTGEKIEEKLKNGKIQEYTGKNRVRIKLNGYIHKNYFSKDIINLHIEEHGTERVSSTVYKVAYTKKKKKLSGCFTSTIADSSGSVIATGENL